MESPIKEKLDPTLFKSFTGLPFTFYLHIIDSDVRLKYAKLIKLCGGVTVESLSEIDGRTLVLVEGLRGPKNYSGFTFKVDYLLASVESGVICHPKDFIVTKPQQSQVLPDFLDIIFWRKYDKLLPYRVRQRSPEGQSTPEESDSDGSFTAPVRYNIPNKNTRHLYSWEEEAEIIKFIVKHKAFNRLKSDAFYKLMEDAGVCPNRSYHSLKGHFLRSMPDLTSFTFLKPIEINALLKARK